MLSILIPSRKEPHLNKTLLDLLAKCEGEFEIIVVLDGYWEQPIDDARIRYIHRGKPLGMRSAINSAVALAKGEYLLKLDAHCVVGQGFDRILTAECETIPSVKYSHESSSFTSIDCRSNGPYFCPASKNR